MNDSTLEMTALITAVPGKETELKLRLQEVVAQTVEEPGCLEFRVFEQTDTPGKFVLWEVFENQAALNLHIAKKYTRAYFASGLVQQTSVIKQRSLSVDPIRPLDRAPNR